MCSSSIQLAPGSRGLSQAEKKAEKIAKWQLFKVVLGEKNRHFGWNAISFWQFAYFVTTVIFFSAWDKSLDSTAKWSKVEHM